MNVFSGMNACIESILLVIYSLVWSLRKSRSWISSSDRAPVLDRSCQGRFSRSCHCAKLNHDCFPGMPYRYSIHHTSDESLAILISQNTIVNIPFRSSTSTKSIIPEMKLSFLSFLSMRPWMSPLERLHVLYRSGRWWISQFFHFAQRDDEFLRLIVFLYWSGDTTDQSLPLLIGRKSIWITYQWSDTYIEPMMREMNLLVFSSRKTWQWMLAPDRVPLFNRSYQRRVS